MSKWLRVLRFIDAAAEEKKDKRRELKSSQWRPDVKLLLPEIEESERKGGKARKDTESIDKC